MLDERIIQVTLIHAIHHPPHSSTPIYRQIIEQVERQVASGQLAKGSTEPSVRAVAQGARHQPDDGQAYSLLEAQGLLVRLRGVGMAVAQPNRHAPA